LIHPNSVKAYYEGQKAFTERHHKVLEYLQEHRIATDREIMRGLGFGEPNAVRPRITELVQAGVLRECGTLSDPETLKTVRLVEVNQPALV
jgi:DNA-binding Lrp family transcriptional regulator